MARGLHPKGRLPSPQRGIRLFAVQIYPQPAARHSATVFGSHGLRPPAPSRRPRLPRWAAPGLPAALMMTIVLTIIATQWRARLLPGTRVRGAPAAVLRPNRLPMTVHARVRA